MKKIIVLIGVSGSGKSTYAANLVQEDPNSHVIVNRDKIRELLFGYTESNVSDYYSREDLSKLEKEVTKYENTLIREGLASGKVVIADATHLKREYLVRYKFWNVPVELKWFPITKEKAIRHNIIRDRKVGVDIIESQLTRFKSLESSLKDKPIDFTPVSFPFDEEKEPCICVDLDGTLARMHSRSPYDWDRVDEDLLDVPVADTVEAFHSLIRTTEVGKIFICTGRDGSSLELSKKWLDHYGVAYDKIFIRQEGDQRPDWVVKEEMWREISESHCIRVLIDDRCQVVDRARALGLKVFQVEYHNF